MLLLWRYYLFWYYKLLCHFMAAISQNLGWILSIMMCFGGVFRGVLHQFPEFWGCVAQLRHRWRHPVCVQGQLMTLQPSSRCCPLRCTEPGLLTPERRIRNSLGWEDPWSRFLSHCRILMSVVAHGFGAAASPTVNCELRNENWMDVGILREKKFLGQNVHI